MAQVESSALRRTPLYARHVALGARMVPFGGWEMPVEYSGITDEHLAVRTRAGVFDVSHMGQIEVAGRDALAGIQHITSNDASKLTIGQAQYAALTTERGAFVDDLLVYRLADEPLPARRQRLEHREGLCLDPARRCRRWRCRGGNTSARYALIAVQGPAAREVLQPLTGADLGMKYYWFATGEVAGVRATISRTGYTGEDGYEVFVAPAYAARVWDALLDAGRAVGPAAGRVWARATRFGSRRRCGCTATTSTTRRACSRLTSSGSSRGPRAILWAAKRSPRRRAAGVPRRLVGFEMIDRAIARHGYPVVVGDQPVGVVTSGTQTPFLKKAIGMAYVPASVAARRRNRHRYPQPARACAPCAAAVLQAVEKSSACIPTP